MVIVTRRHLVLAMITGLLVGGMSKSAQAGLISVACCDETPFDPLVTPSPSLPLSVVLDICLKDDPGPGMAVPLDSHDEPKQPTQPVLPFFVFFSDDVAVGMQAASQSGMSGVSTTVGPQSSGNSLAAVPCTALQLADPPLVARIWDEPHLILPSGPPFELLRPA